MKPHTFHPEAAEEYAAAADYYFKIQPELGGRFYEEIERLIETISEQPDLFRLFDPPASSPFFQHLPVRGYIHRTTRPHLDRRHHEL